MKDQVSVGMIGTSWYADRMHLPALKSHVGARLTAICGRDQVRAAELAAKYEIPNLYAGYRDMLQHGDLDAVIIAVPDDLHYPITMAALDAAVGRTCRRDATARRSQARPPCGAGQGWKWARVG
jgi:predicted dehydrogenase